MALLEFYGTECPHCANMAELVERLQKEEGLAVEQLEVWHNEENAKRLAELDKGLCGGVPFFYNTESHAVVCGEAPYEEMKRWAMGKS